jgi:hypothetical protein
MKPTTRSLRVIPSVEKLLLALGETRLPRPVVVALVRRELGALRQQEKIPDFVAIVAGLRGSLASLRH